MGQYLGVTAGKFNPPHVGHRHLIEAARARCEELHVLVCDRADQTIPAQQRLEWLRDASPSDVVFHLTPDDLPADDSVAWGQRALELLERRPDVAFTSEDYGDTWAEAMDCDHIRIDLPDPSPVRGTDLRADLAAHFEHLVPAARAALARRFVLVGAESTGKTALAEHLARHFGTVWVPEWARTYDLGKQSEPGYDWTAEEFLLIGRQQAAMEDALARRARAGLLFADTDPLATCVWRRRYLGDDDPALLELASSRRPALYLLCEPDVPWVQDGTRESEPHRRSMHDDFVATLAASGVPWVRVTGAGDDRFEAAAAAVSDLPTFDQLV